YIPKRSDVMSSVPDGHGTWYRPSAQALSLHWLATTDLPSCIPRPTEATFIELVWIVLLSKPIFKLFVQLLLFPAPLRNPITLSPCNFTTAYVLAFGNNAGAQGLRGWESPACP